MNMTERWIEFTKKYPYVLWAHYPVMNWSKVHDAIREQGRYPSDILAELNCDYAINVSDDFEICEIVFADPAAYDLIRLLYNI